jgi:hypothetical protein
MQANILPLRSLFGIDLARNKCLIKIKEKALPALPLSAFAALKILLGLWTSLLSQNK